MTSFDITGEKKRYNKYIDDISNSIVCVDNNSKNRPRDLTKYKRTTKFFLSQTKFSEGFFLFYWIML